MIKYYVPFNDEFDSNGDAVLIPTKCTVTEEAGAGYELSMTHPLDEAGVWQLIQVGGIIKAPIPAYTAKAIDGQPGTQYWLTTKDVNVITHPSYSQAIKYQFWHMGSSTNFQKGDKVTENFSSGGKYWYHNYQCIKTPLGAAKLQRPSEFSEAWQRIADVSTYSGKTLVKLSTGTQVRFIENYNGEWARVCTANGIEGYVPRGSIAYYSTIPTGDIKTRLVDKQLFRIYRTQVDSAKQTLTVNARHVSYDLNANLVGECTLTDADPAIALSAIKTALRDPVELTIATNIDTGTFTGDLENKNGINALLDPDAGWIAAFDAELRRDNWDIFFYAKSTDETPRVTLEYGVNLKGVSWKEDASELITRVMPVAKDASDNDLFLTDIFVDSPNIELYPVHRAERLQIDQKIGGDDGAGGTWTADTLRAFMESEAEKRFSVDKCDLPETEIKVEFIMLGDTVEYQQYKDLEQLSIYDWVRVHHAGIGLDKTLQVSKYEYDCIGKRFNSITLGEISNNLMRLITGYNIRNGAIEINKLSADAIKKLKEA